MIPILLTLACAGPQDGVSTVRGPNLVITELVDEGEAGAHLFTVQVQDVGDVGADAFSVDLFLDRDLAPQAGQIGDLREHVPEGLDVGEGIQVRFDSPDSQEGDQVWVLLDPTNEVDEFDEDDNTASLVVGG